MGSEDKVGRIGYRTLLTVAAVVVVVAGLRASGDIFVPFLLAIFLSILCAPFVLWLERRGLAAWLSVLVVIAGAMTVLTGFGALLIGSVADFREAIPRYQERFQHLSDELYVMLRRIDVDVSFSQLYGAFEPGSVIDMVGTTLTGLVAALLDTSLVLLMMIFMLLEAAGFPRKLRAAMHDPNADLGRYVRMTTEVQRYLVIKTIISMFTGLLIGVWTWGIGVDFPMLWALTAFLLNYIPNVGSVIAAVPAVLVAMVQIGVGHALAVAGGYVVVNMVMGNIVEPQWMGRKLGLSPLVVFLSLVFWGWVWGPLGMLL